MVATIQDQNKKVRKQEISVGSFNQIKIGKDEYWQERRSGLNLETGKVVHLLASEDGKQIWATADAKMIWEN